MSPGNRSRHPRRRRIMSVAASLMLAACGTDVPTEPRRDPEVEPQPERVIWRVEGRGVNKVPSADATTV